MPARISVISTIKVALALLAAAAAAPPFPPRGAAAWVYDAKGGQPAEWASDIAAFNAVAVQPISTVFSYGGDMEWCVFVTLVLVWASLRADAAPR